jgi:O-antigen ligase
MTNQAATNKLAVASEAAFLLVVLSLGFMQPTLNIRGISLTATEPVFLLAAAIWLLAVVCRRVEFKFERIYIWLLLYAVGLTLSAVFSANPRQSFIKLAGELYLIALAALASNIVRSPAQLKRSAFVWIAAGTLCSLIGCIAVASFYAGSENFVTHFALHGFGSLPPGHYPRLQGTFEYPAILCNYLTVAMMMLAAAWYSGWIRTPLALPILILMSVSIAFTLTPGIGGVVLAGCVWGCYVLNKRGNRPLANVLLSFGITAAVAAVVVSAITIIPSPTSPFYWSIGGIRLDPTQRLLTWTEAGKTFLSHPLFGKGVGLPVAEVYFMPPSGQMQILTDAHNFILNIAGQAGVAGLIPLLIICFVVVRRGCARFCEQSDTHLPAAMWIAFVSAFLVQGLVGSFEDCRHLWVLIGLVITASRLQDAPC